MREFGENPLQMIFRLEKLGNGKVGKFYSRDLCLNHQLGNLYHIVCTHNC